MTQLTEIAAQALVRRTERRKAIASDFEGISLDALEEMESMTLSEAQRANLKEHAMLYKRRLKVEFEIREKRGDFREKAALPIAVSMFSITAWFMNVLQLTSDARMGVDIIAFAVSVLTWGMIRLNALGLIGLARRNLAALGKVD
ncbi:hypothetical protein [Variovorax sp. ZS18.2.2]|uniref:hypothetical protein n=1 Tax=Variovorax sp. ZS18.2.2 TaxID=2971255 RepID=UPI0021516584|nr:hypothetical protein [Variovorax sp. ZS18.2.2]